MIGGYRLAALLAATAFTAGSAWGDEPRQLANNPFSRPPSELVGGPNAELLPDGRVRPLDLRATMVGTMRRFADVGGRILHPGDEIAGYTLLEVHEDSAIFSRGGEPLTVYVRPQRIEDDE